MNLSYEVTHEELRELFGKYGEVESVEVPLRKGGKGQAAGIAYVAYKETEQAVASFAALDKSYFQGRKIHILPAKEKPPQEPQEFKSRNNEEVNKEK